MSEPTCFVYAIATSRNGRPVAPVKIGISAMPHARLRELQIGSPAPLILVAMLLAPTREVARATEKFIHDCHPDRRKHGEWFDLSPWYVAGMIGEFLALELESHFGGLVTSSDATIGDPE